MSSPPFLLTPESFKYVVTHVFFPLVLPGKNDCTIENELSLIDMACDAAHAYTPHIHGTSELEEYRWHRITKMLDNLRASLHPESLERDHIVSRLSGMTRGDILTFFIRPQNAAIILMKQENCTLCEAFEVSPCNNAVEGTLGSLICSYPWSAVEIPNDLLDDGDFQSELADFLSLPSTVNADLPRPPRDRSQYLTVLLAGILRGVCNIADVVGITKHIRDNVGEWPLQHSGGIQGSWRRSSIWLLLRVSIQMSVDRSPPGRTFYKRFVLYFMCSLVKCGNNANISNDLLHLMSSKIFRRLSKLGPSIPGWLSELALETCAFLRKVLDARWKQLSSRPSLFHNPTNGELVRDTKLSLANSAEYIRRTLSSPRSIPSRTPFHPDQLCRGSLEDFLSLNGTFFDEAYSADPNVTLFDVERSVLEEIDDWLACIVNRDRACAQLEVLMDQYFTKRGPQPKDNPEQSSIQFLTAIELFVALDKLAVKEVPMMADYSPEILMAWLESLCLSKATHLHRLSRASQYLSSRQSKSRPGWSVFSSEFTKDSFPVRYYDHSLRLQQLKARIEQVAHLVDTHDEPPERLARQIVLELSKSPLPPIAKVVVFELQCPPCIRIWRSAVARVQEFVDARWSRVDPYKEKRPMFLSEVPELRRYSLDLGPPLSMQICPAYFYPDGFRSRNFPTLRYVARCFGTDSLEERKVRFWVWEPLHSDLGSEDDQGYGGLKVYVNSTTHTSNNASAKQADCPADLSLDEFTAFARLRSGGSLQWLNILHGLRSRALNLRSKEVHSLLSLAVTQVGPLDPNTGTWIWHQELQDASFCGALLDELCNLLADGAGLVDDVFMNNISLLLARVLASSPGKEVSKRAIELLRSIRSKTFHWVQELSYDLTMAPTSEERKSFLLHMAATCRSTFDIDCNGLHELLCSTEDVDALLSCAFFVRALSLNRVPTNEYIKRLLERDSCLTLALEDCLRDVILVDPSDYGIDLAVAKIFAAYWPGPKRWETLQSPDSHWLACETKMSLHVNLLDASLRADGQPCGALPKEIKEELEWLGLLSIFNRQSFFVMPSDIPEMDFMALVTTSKHKVHFSLRYDVPVVQLQCGQTSTVLQLIPSRRLKQDLPPTLVEDHVHWLDLSSKVIEIRPRVRLWEQSSENWRIDCTSGEYRAYKGYQTLVDVHSPAWEMVTRCFECFGVRAIPKQRAPLPSNLLITTSLPDSDDFARGLRLSITLPRYGMSFFVNEMDELESQDFKDMIYDENQSTGTLFGLDNLLVLRPKVRIASSLIPESLIPRYILIPNGHPERDKNDEVRFTISATPDKPLYHVYIEDAELGCLTSNGNLSSTWLLAYLHAMTSFHRPDPLTGTTGADVALRLLQSAGCRSIMKLKVPLDATALIRGYWKLTKYPQVPIVHDEIQSRYYWNRRAHTFGMSKRVTAGMRASRRAMYLLFESSPKAPISTVTEDLADPKYSITEADVELGDIVSAAASAIHCWSIGMPTVDTVLNWTKLWGGLSPDLSKALTGRVRGILEKSEKSRQRFQLLFLLPTLAYCSSSHQAAFLSMLMAFALQTKSSLVNMSPYTDCKILDGYRPTEQVLRDHILDCCMEKKYARSSSVDGVVKNLLESWPRDVSRIVQSLNPHRCDLASLTASLQQLSFSYSRNLNLKEYLLRVLAGPSLPLPRSIPPAQHMSNEHPFLQITLDQLLSNRPAPQLPQRSTLKFDWCRMDKVSDASNNAIALDRLFSPLPTKFAFQQEYLALLEKSASVCNASEITYESTAKDRLDALQKYYMECKTHYAEALDKLRHGLGPMTDHERLLEQFGRWPTITADVLLRYLTSTSPFYLPEQWKKCLISFALLLLELQRARRLLRFTMDGLEEEFKKELGNEQCDGWDPETYPDWLLIQVQGNFLIRRAQADTAMALMSPQSRGNTVMQVNMGEGKSSVIIPIVAAALADGKQLVRVIVPRAQIVKMFELLVSRLGWLTNRTIYHLPFSRNSECEGGTSGRQVISPQIDDLEKFMSECIARRGVLLLQPEHAASLKLKSVEEQIHTCKRGTDPSTSHQKLVYNHFRLVRSLRLLPDESFVGAIFRWMSPSSRQSKTDCNAGADRCTEQSEDTKRTSKWAQLQKRIHSRARDILDESDEILHSRFQLIYTVGTAQHMDGYPDRWATVQQILQLVRYHVEIISRNHPDSVEYERGPLGSFPHVRFVRASALWPRLTSMVADDVMAGRLPNFNFQRISCAALHDAIRTFITTDIFPISDTARRVEEYAKSSHQSYLWPGLLLLRGLLSSNVLQFALSEKRWRVDYGLVQSRSTVHTMLAVPYRAKDVPASNTQFGHPDLTIILTCLSYYYAGLTEEQLRTSFEILLDRDDPSVEYNLWIQDYESVPDWLRNLSDVNLRSSEQWDKVTFPLFTRNQAVIDFYLSRVVFPKEAKEFSWKICASSWDLGEKREKLITGFSGTGDSRWLLPMSVVQHDLDHLRGTSANVLANLLRPENDFYIVTHESGARHGTHQLLRLMTLQRPEIRVLLDVGAQILDSSNRQVAEAWLDTIRDASGAVYFDENDELVVLTQNGITQPLSSSPLSEQLEKCVAYLDHPHTRGTDLKFPVGSRAAVTLGPGVTKDALVQGCMRMRKLGRGHSIMFFAPPGVDQDIRSLIEKQGQNVRVSIVDVIRWAVQETWADIQRRAPYWAQQGVDHQSRHGALSGFFKNELMPQQLSDVWLQPNRKSLAELYAPGETEDAQIDLSSVPGMQQRCTNLGILSVSSTGLEEEQEREVHRQREREREVELPPEAEPAEHALHADIVSFVKTGIIPPLHPGGAFLPVFSTLGKSSAASRDADVWNTSILATVDFSRTIKPESTEGTMDQYLQPVQWILSSKRGCGPVLVIVSPFEANELMPNIRASEHVHLHLYAPRTALRMKPSDDLRLYAIPPLPSDWAPPWDLIDQLNVFAGQLYLRDYRSYERLCRFLEVPSSESSSSTIHVQRNLFNIPGSFEEMEITFSGSPLPTVMALLAIRTRGKPFAHTHMGRILQGQILTENDFEKPKWDTS